MVISFTAGPFQSSLTVTVAFLPLLPWVKLAGGLMVTLPPFGALQSLSVFAQVAVMVASVASYVQMWVCSAGALLFVSTSCFLVLSYLTSRVSSSLKKMPL